MKRFRLGFEVPSPLFCYRMIALFALGLWVEMCITLLILTNINQWAWTAVSIVPFYVLIIPLGTVVRKALKTSGSDER